MQGDQVANKKKYPSNICPETVQQFSEEFGSINWTQIGQKLDLNVAMWAKTGFEEVNSWIYETKPVQK